LAFLSSEKVHSRWKALATAFGWKLSAGKSFCSKNFVQINSKTYPVVHGHLKEEIPIVNYGWHSFMGKDVKQLDESDVESFATDLQTQILSLDRLPVALRSRVHQSWLSNAARVGRRAYQEKELPYRLVPELPFNFGGLGFGFDLYSTEHGLELRSEDLVNYMQFASQFDLCKEKFQKATLGSTYEGSLNSMTAEQRLWYEVLGPVEEWVGSDLGKHINLQNAKGKCKRFGIRDAARCAGFESLEELDQVSATVFREGLREATRRCTQSGDGLRVLGTGGAFNLRRRNDVSQSTPHLVTGIGFCRGRDFFHIIRKSSGTQLFSKVSSNRVKSTPCGLPGLGRGAPEVSVPYSCCGPRGFVRKLQLAFSDLFARGFCEDNPSSIEFINGCFQDLAPSTGYLDEYRTEGGRHSNMSSEANA